MPHKIDDVKFRACDAVEQTTLVIQEDDLERLQLLHKFSGRYIGVHVE